MLQKFTLTKTIVLLVLFFTCFTAPVITYAQSCGCDTVIKKDVYRFDASNVAPGKTICLESGIRTSNLVISNITGTKANRIIIKNCGGKTIFKLSSGLSFGIKFENSKNFRLTGTGSNDFYGIVVDSSNIGMQVGDLSSDFEVDHIELSHSGFCGVMAKTDNSGPRITGFKMKNVSFHDNHVFKTNLGEGFYIGNTGWEVNGQQHDIDSLEVYNNITDSTGSEGIQVGCTYSGNAKIYNNRVTNPGYNPFENYQSNGIQLGNGFSGKCYNNYIEKPGGNGLIVLGPGNIYAFNNVIVNPGAFGIYTGQATAEAGKTFNYLHNTIIMPANSTQPAIKYDPVAMCTTYVYNNAIVRTDTTTNSTFDKQSGAMILKGNIVRNNVSAFNFKNPSSNNYDLLAGSPAINAGFDVTSFGITWDYEYRPRPVGNYDAGAYEFQQPLQSTVLYRVNAGGLEVVDSILNWAKDKQLEPCIWLDSINSAYYTTGSDQPWTGTNNTDAPSQIFSTCRYAMSWKNHVNYKFPVNNGTYEVRLYFAENEYQAIGQRMFDVNIEGITKMHNFDIYAAAGYQKAYKVTFIVNVNDGILNLDFIGGTAEPQINGIAILSSDSGTNKSTSTASTLVNEKVLDAGNTISAYPVPLRDNLYVQKKATGINNTKDVEEVEVSLFNKTGKIIYQGKHTFTSGLMNPVNLLPLKLTPGIYFLKISGNATKEIMSLLK